jgi:heme-degrading monooxygenase HmoA
VQTAIQSLLFGGALAMAAGGSHAATSLTHTGQGIGQGTTTPTVVVVKVPTPWYAPNWLVLRKMRAALPTYRVIPGLTFKAFTFARPDGEFGGVYLWQDRASLEAWFNSAWFARVRKERGVEPEVRMFETLSVLDTRDTASAVGPQAAGLEAIDDAVIVVVTRSRPPGATPEQLQRGFAAEAAIERNAPGLLRKYGVLVGDDRFGGVYLWRDEASARRWFDVKWTAKVRALDGADPELEWLEAPILMPSTLEANRDADRALRAASFGSKP